MTPIMHRDAERVLKTGKAYVSSSGDAVLLEALAIEAERKQAFLVLVQGRADGVVVRLHPLIDPEKTDGVKLVLALVSKQIREKVAGTTFGETNLHDFL